MLLAASSSRARAIDAARQVADSAIIGPAAVGGMFVRATQCESAQCGKRPAEQQDDANGTIQHHYAGADGCAGTWAETAKMTLASREKGMILSGQGNRCGPISEPSSDQSELAQLHRSAVKYRDIRPDVDAVLRGAILAAAYFTTVQRWISTEPPPFNLTDRSTDAGRPAPRSDGRPGSGAAAAWSRPGPRPVSSVTGGQAAV